MPSLFIAHGAPTLAVENNDYSLFLQNLGQTLEKPKAIIVFTAHWETEMPAIASTDDRYETVYDFGGFSDELYSMKYDAPGSTEIASRVKKCLVEQGIAAKMDAQRGLDHGVWVVLRLLYPEAEIPVIPVSVNPWLPPAEQYRIGQALKSLKDEGVLVIGSGGTVHNLRRIVWNAPEPETWAVQFDDWLIDKLQKRDLDSLFAYEQLAPHAALAVPRPEHFMPFFLAMGAGDDSGEAQILFRGYDFGTLSYICCQF